MSFFPSVGHPWAIQEHTLSYKTEYTFKMLFFVDIFIPFVVFLSILYDACCKIQILTMNMLVIDFIFVYMWSQCERPSNSISLKWRVYPIQ